MGCNVKLLFWRQIRCHCSQSNLKLHATSHVYAYLRGGFGKGGILRLGFRETGRHIAALTLEQMCCLFTLKRTPITPVLLGYWTVVVGTGEIISSRAVVCVYRPFHVLCWSGNNTRELCCLLRSRHLYSQSNCSLYSTFIARQVLLPPLLSFLSHSFTVCTLPLSRSPTHTSCTALFLKGATPLLQQQIGLL